MTTEELDEWAVDFERFCARFADVFGRKEPRAQAAKYLRGLLASVPRKNGWQVAEAVGDRIPDATQRLLYQAQWRADAARDRPAAIRDRGLRRRRRHRRGGRDRLHQERQPLGGRQTPVLGHGGQDRELPDRHLSELCDGQGPRLPGSPPVSARGVVRRCRAASAGQGARGRGLPDQARAGDGDVAHMPGRRACPCAGWPATKSTASRPPCGM